MCSLRIWWMAVGMRQRRPSPMVELWPCPDSRKPEVQVEPLKFMISKELERVGIHRPAFPSALRFYPRLELLPGGKVFYTGHGSGTSSANAWIFNPATGGWAQSAATNRNPRSEERR